MSNQISGYNSNYDSRRFRSERFDRRHPGSAAASRHQPFKSTSFSSNSSSYRDRENTSQEHLAPEVARHLQEEALKHLGPTARIGTFKWYNDVKKYGFISVNENDVSKDVYFRMGMQRSLSIVEGKMELVTPRRHCVLTDRMNLIVSVLPGANDRLHAGWFITINDFSEALGNLA